MILAWLKRRRRRQLLARPFPAEWREYLAQNVRHYQYLARDQQAVLRQISRVFIAEKEWVGCDGLTLSDEMKVTVAGQASLLALGLCEPYYYDWVSSIILHPRSFAHRQARTSWGAIVEDSLVGGWASRNGPIALSWEAVRASGRDDNGGYNIVLHEFAHHLDGLNGELEGAPPLPRGQERNWYRVAEAEYLRLVGNAQRDEVSLLQHYGAKSKVEFFAVATECFFERPSAMRREHKELYTALRGFYRQDPAEWLPDAKARPTPPPAGRADWRELAAKERLPAALASKNAARLSALAMEYLKNNWYGLAVRVLSRVIELKPSDAEAYQQRALARLHLREYVGALTDAEEALRLDGDDTTAYRIRGAAYVALRQFERATCDLDRVLREHRNDAEAFYLRGVAFAGLARWRRAVRDLSMSLAIRPYAAEAYYQRAGAYRQLRRSKLADSDLEKAIQLDPRVGWTK